MSLSDEKKLLLKKGVENGGVIKVSMAEALYSSRSSAKSAITSLEFKGFIEKKTPGVFEIVKLPENVKQQLKEELEN